MSRVCRSHKGSADCGRNFPYGCRGQSLRCRERRFNRDFSAVIKRLAAVCAIEGVVRARLAWRPLGVVLAVALMQAGWSVAGVLSALDLTADVWGPRPLLDGRRLEPALLTRAVVSGRKIVVRWCPMTFVVALATYGCPRAGPSCWRLRPAADCLPRGGVRLPRGSWHRQQPEIRHQEQVALARRMHDMVAHHYRPSPCRRRPMAYRHLQPENVGEALEPGVVGGELCRIALSGPRLTDIFLDSEPTIRCACELRLS